MVPPPPHSETKNPLTTGFLRLMVFFFWMGMVMQLVKFVPIFGIIDKAGGWIGDFLVFLLTCCVFKIPFLSEALAILGAWLAWGWNPALSLLLFTWHPLSMFALNLYISPKLDSAKN